MGISRFVAIHVKQFTKKLTGLITIAEDFKFSLDTDEKVDPLPFWSLSLQNYSFQTKEFCSVFRCRTLSEFNWCLSLAIKWNWTTNSRNMLKIMSWKFNEMLTLCYLRGLQLTRNMPKIEIRVNKFVSLCGFINKCRISIQANISSLI